MDIIGLYKPQETRSLDLGKTIYISYEYNNHLFYQEINLDKSNSFTDSKCEFYISRGIVRYKLPGFKNFRLSNNENELFDLGQVELKYDLNFNGNNSLNGIELNKSKIGIAFNETQYRIRLP